MNTMENKDFFAKETFLSLTEFLGENTRHIVNGMCMKKRFYDVFGCRKNSVCAFNEAMCDGSASKKIFSEDFISERCAFLHVSEEDYRKNVTDELQGILSSPSLALWFGTDMFCQINLLTLLAFLDRNNYRGALFCGLIREETDEIISFSQIAPTSFYDVYCSVVVDRKNTPVPEPVSENAVRLYLTYRQKNSPIRRFIRTRADDRSLLAALLSSFPQYGLGDVQYLKLIDEELHP